MKARRPPVNLVVASGLAALVGASAFLDDLLESRPLRGPDFLLAGLLAVSTLVVLLVLERVVTAREQHAAEAQRRREDVSALHTLGNRGTATDFLERIVGYAREALSVESAVIALGDDQEPASATVVAAQGPGAPAAGSRVPTSVGLYAAIDSGPETVALDGSLATAHVLAADHLDGDASTAAAAPIAWDGERRGLLAVSCSEPGRRLGDRELGVLSELAELSSLAVGQVELRKRAEHTLRGYVGAFAIALDVRDQYTGSHSEQVVELSLAVGGRLGLDHDEMVELELAARMHDIGKLGVPDSILNKQGPLDASEWAVIREHPVWGSECLAGVSGLEGVAEVIRAEHERWDGNGYPDGLEGEQIPLASRIILTCDAFHAMTSDRPYRKAMRTDEAVEELESNAGTQFDPHTVDALVSVLRNEGKRGPAPRRSVGSPKQK